MSSDKINTPYSPYKIMHHPDRIADLKQGKMPKPISAIIYPSALCSQDCSWCSYRLSNYTHMLGSFGEKDPLTGVVNHNPNRMCTYEKMIELLDDLSLIGCKAIEYSGSGEPTVHPKHKEFFQYTLDKGMDLSLVSNGVNWKDGVVDILSRAKWVRVSIDASNIDTYVNTRRCPKAHWDKAINNIKALVEAKNKNKTDVLIGVGFVTHNENYEEMYDAVKLYKELGVDNVRVSCLFTADGIEYVRPFYAKALELAKKCVKDFNDDKFKVHNLFTDRAEDLENGNPNFKMCAQQFVNLLIAADKYELYRCCQTSYNELGLIGSFKDRRFIDLWNDPKTKEIMYSFEPSTCWSCQFSNRNNLINYLILDDPLHVNYV